MSNYDETNTFALFTNKEKKTDKHPNLTGRLNVDGTEFRIAAWVKKNPDGSLKVISGKVNIEDSRPKQSGGSDNRPPKDFDNSDIPW